VALGTAASDAVNRLLVSGENALFTSPGDLRLTLSKGARADDAVLALHFSTGFLTGLLGNNDFTLKSSPDGTTYSWPPALVVNGKSGRAVFKKPQHGARPFNIVQRNYVANSAWPLSTTPADNSWMSVTCSLELGLFCAVAETGTGNRVTTSPDGITWTARTTTVANSWFAVA